MNIFQNQNLREEVKVEIDLAIYAIKADLKNARGVDTSKLAKMVDLASLKSNIDKLDIDKLKNVQINLKQIEKKKVDKLYFDKLVRVPVDSSKLSDAVKNNVAKKDAKIKNIEDKMLDITNLAAKTNLNAKISEVKKEMPSSTNLASTAAFNAKKMRLKAKYLISITLLVLQFLLLLKIKCLVIVIQSKKLTIMIIINILLLQNLINKR